MDSQFRCYHLNIGSRLLANVIGMRAASVHSLILMVSMVSGMSFWLGTAIRSQYWNLTSIDRGTWLGVTCLAHLGARVARQLASSLLRTDGSGELR